MKNNYHKLDEFWVLLKEWYADPTTKYSAEDIISWIDDFVEDPETALKDLNKMNDDYEEEIKDD